VTQIMVKFSQVVGQRGGDRPCAAERQLAIAEQNPIALIQASTP
jgi:hypothetical protein